MVGYRDKKLDDALDQVVGEAAEVARDAAQGESDHEAEQDTDQADGDRDAGAVDHPREQVAAEAVGAEDEERSVLGAEQVQVGTEQVPQLVVDPAHEQADDVLLLRVFVVLPAQRLAVAGAVQAVDERPLQALLVNEEVHLGGRYEQVFGVGGGGVRRDELGADGDQVEQPQDDDRRQRQPVLLELPPHEGELGGVVVAFLALGHVSGPLPR